MLNSLGAIFSILSFIVSLLAFLGITTVIKRTKKYREMATLKQLHEEIESIHPGKHDK